MSSAKSLGVFAIGVAAGAAVALIYAPDTGEGTRKYLKRRLDHASDYAAVAGDIISNKAEKVARHGKKAWGDIEESASSAAQKLGS